MNKRHARKKKTKATENDLKLLSDHNLRSKSHWEMQTREGGAQSERIKTDFLFRIGPTGVSVTAVLLLYPVHN